MPAEKTPATDPSLKKKQILVIVLLAGLLLAIMTQPSEDAEAGPSANAKSANKPKPSATTAIEFESSPQGQSPSAETHSLDLTAVSMMSRIEHDDIARLELLAPEPDPVKKKLINRTQRVQAVYGTSSGHAALLGESIVRRGQPLPSGEKVLQITTDGIQIAP